jgi:hypothetical protein
MPITFEPMRMKVQKYRADLTVSVRSYPKKTMALELSVSPEIQDRVKYLNGDLVVVHYNEDDKSVTIERVPGSQRGYRVQVVARKNSRPAAIFKVGCDAQSARSVLGDEQVKQFVLFEINGHKVTFVEQD